MKSRTLTCINNNPNPQPIKTHNLNRNIAFTTPLNYAQRLSSLLLLKGWTPVCSPTITIQPTPHYLKPYVQTLDSFAAIAFTSRSGISALSQTLTDIHQPPLSCSGDLFTVAALGKDSELIEREGLVMKLCGNADRVRVLVPAIATPGSLVEALGLGFGRKVLCPVPVVVGLEEPPVVPEFLRGLEGSGWLAVRVGAYETRWAGPEAAARVVESEWLDGLVFTSTAEVEGMLKSLRDGYGVEWEEVRRRWPEIVVAAHGPVTAAGAERLGVEVDVVSSKFDSFDGVVEALDSRFQAFRDP